MFLSLLFLIRFINLCVKLYQSIYSTPIHVHQSMYTNPSTIHLKFSSNRRIYYYSFIKWPSDHRIRRSNYPPSICRSAARIFSRECQRTPPGFSGLISGCPYPICLRVQLLSRRPECHLLNQWRMHSSSFLPMFPASCESFLLFKCQYIYPGIVLLFLTKVGYSKIHVWVAYSSLKYYLIETNGSHIVEILVAFDWDEWLSDCLKNVFN